MKQSQYDPTLKDHFTENEARRWIRHLEKIIESLEKREKEAKARNANFSRLNTELKRKIRRFIFRMQVLQERHPEIDFGLDEFLVMKQEEEY